MRKKRKAYRPEEKVAIIRRHLLDNVAISDLCDEHKLNPNVYFLVPKLSLGTRGKKLCFAWLLSLEMRNKKLRFGYKIHPLCDRQKTTTAHGPKPILQLSGRGRANRGLYGLWLCSRAR